MTRKSRQKIKYIENEKSFQGEIKSKFHHLERTFIEANKADISGRLEPVF